MVNMVKVWGTLVLAAFVGGLVAPAPAEAQRLVLLVRHAERADGGVPAPNMSTPADPDLSAEGRARADRLAVMLAQAGVTRIVVSEFKRTQQTAAPLAKLLGVTVQTISSKDTAALVSRLKSAKGTVLVVAHSNTVPEIVKGLGIATAVTIGEADHDDLFVVTPGERPALVRLHYR